MAAVGRSLARVNAGVERITDVTLNGEPLCEAVDIESLVLHSNALVRIEGLDKLRRLRRLDLSSNRITRIEGLEALRALEDLDLSANELTDLAGLGMLRNLRRLAVAFNAVATLRGMAELHGSDASLVELDLRGNRIDRAEELAWLRGATREGGVGRESLGRGKM